MESDQLDNRPAIEKVLREYLEQSHAEDLDSIVLGCTHFVFFGQILRELTGNRVKIVDGNTGTARHLKDLLEKKDLLAGEENTGSLTIANSDPAKLDLSQRLIQRLEDEYDEPERLADLHA